jgi:hypothetical protein
MPHLAVHTGRRTQATRGLTLDLPDGGRVEHNEHDVTLELDFYEEHATKKEHAFYQKYTDGDSSYGSHSHNAQDQKRLQRLKSKYLEEYERLYWQNLAYTYWTMTHDSGTGERSMWWER